jgi:hypothetical protein
MIEWNIQSRAHACCACAKLFADKQPYHTMLFDESQGFERFDVCEMCWATQYSQGATSRKGFISHWQGVFEVQSAQPEPIQKENAESLLRKLAELNDPKYGSVCFILAVMLERKRVLKVKDQIQRDGRRIFIYEHSKNGDVLTIADPNLRLDQLEEVQRDVGHLLERGLNPLVEAQPTASAPAEAQPTETAGAGPPTKPAEQPVVC